MYKLASLKNPKVSSKVMNSLNTIKQKFNEKQLKEMILSEESKQLQEKTKVKLRQQLEKRSLE